LDIWRLKVWNMPGLGKALIVVGVVLIVVGLLFSFAGRIPWLGQLPGDIYIQRERYTFYFPLTTSVLISLVISLVLYLLRR
jgi:uncharacterized protein HemY